VDEKIITSPIKESTKEQTKDLIKESIKESTKEQTKDLIKESIKEPIKDLTKENSNTNIPLVSQSISSTLNTRLEYIEEQNTNILKQLRQYEKYYECTIQMLDATANKLQQIEGTLSLIEERQSKQVTIVSLFYLFISWLFITIFKSFNGDSSSNEIKSIRRESQSVLTTTNIHTNIITKDT